MLYYTILYMALDKHLQNKLMNRDKYTFYFTKVDKESPNKYGRKERKDFSFFFRFDTLSTEGKCMGGLKNK